MDSSSPGLSPSEEYLLALIRDGLRDAEIAVRLGITIGEVKERLQRLASRLMVDGRAGLSAIATMPTWPAPVDLQSHPPKREEAAGFELSYVSPPAQEQRMPARDTFRSIGSVAAALACVVGALYWIASADGSPATTAPERTAASSFAAPSEVEVLPLVTVDGIHAIRAREGSPIRLPEGLRVYVEANCVDPSHCDGPFALDGVRSEGGKIQRETLQAARDGGAIGGVVMSGDGQRIVTAVGGGTPGIATSEDGGATWEADLALPDPDTAPLGFIGNDVLLGTAAGRYYRLPSGELFDPEMNGRVLGVDREGQVLLWLNREVVRSEGTRMVQPRIPGYVEPLWAAELPDGSLAIGWHGGAAGAETPTWTIAILGPAGGVEVAITGLSAPPAGFIDGQRALVAAEQFGLLPTILDLRTGVLDPIVGAFEAYKARQGTFLVGLLAGDT